MPSNLIKFWRNCPIDSKLLAHPEDLNLLTRRGAVLPESMPQSFESFIAAPRFDDWRMHLKLLPQPYAGDLRKAEIFILLLNPGLGYTDYWGESRMKSFRRQLENNLRQELEGIEFPFLWLNPEFCWHGGFVWWEKKLRDVASLIASEKFNGRYIDALRDLSTKIASLELLPYHSFSFGAHGLIEELPSVNVMREFVRERLALEAKSGKKTLIVTRQQKAWDLPAKEENIIIYTGGHTRGASLSTNSEGGKAILRRHGITHAV
jgi:hypothetical protein